MYKICNMCYKIIKNLITCIGTVNTEFLFSLKKN